MRIGTRGSALALVQAHWVAERLGPGVEVVEITTVGDRVAGINDKSRWVSELERALLDGRIDIAVHSAKDVPTELPEGLELVAIPQRAEARDVICGAPALGALAPGSRVGTSSLRRAAQVRAVRDDVDVRELRGNVDTRLRKLAAGEFDALILAAAGLDRLGRADDAGGLIDEFVPAAGQGALALEARSGAIASERLTAVADPDATVCVNAERVLVHALGASCNTPVGAHARVLDDGRLTLRAWVGLPDGSAWLRDEVTGDAGEVGLACAERMLATGAAELPAPRRGGGERVTVYLVGAGPGDPGLMTARALELLAAADVIVYDRLIPATALEGARADARLVYAGKEGGGPSASQQEIEALLLEHGAAGREVVRLKGGDPFVFGRGGEEAEALRAAGIAFEIVPGITAGVAASAYAGIPVTHRDAASAVAFVTGHEDPAKFGVGESGPARPSLDWAALARFPGTLVVYMGVRRLEAIAHELMAGGRAGTEPAAVIQRGTLPDQRVVTGTLQTIAAEAAAAGVKAPAISLFGPVAALRPELAWFESRPLGGRTVAVTRARAQASGLAGRLRELGAAVIEAPAIRIQEIDGPAPHLADYDLVCLTSPNGVRLLLDRLHRAGQDARAFGRARLAAIGPGTARALREHGLIADVVPERFVAEGLVEALADVPVSRALIARAAVARDVLPDALRARGAQVDVIELYETVAEPMSGRQREAVRDADYVTFTSSSTVRFFFASLYGAVPERARLVSIGPVTSQTLREHGREPDVEATRHDIDGLVDALVADVRSAFPG